MDKIKFQKILLKNCDKLKVKKHNISFSKTPTIKKLRNVKNAFSGNNNDIKQNLTTNQSKKNLYDNYSSTSNNFSKIKTLKYIQDNIIPHEGVGNEKFVFEKYCTGHKGYLAWC